VAHSRKGMRVRSYQRRGAGETSYAVRMVGAQNPCGAVPSPDHPFDRFRPGRITSFEQGRGDAPNERQPRLSTGADTIGQLIKQRFDPRLPVRVMGIVLLGQQEDHFSPHDLFVELDPRGFA